jgi:hypothetical protein
MADYKESTISGTEYTRCVAVNISNPIGSVPQIQFIEESVATLGPRSFHEPKGFIQINFDPSASIPVVDPGTLEETGASITMGSLYLGVFSAYIATARARDEAEALALLPPDPVPEPSDPQG